MRFFPVFRWLSQETSPAPFFKGILNEKVVPEAKQCDLLPINWQRDIRPGHSSMSSGM
jgi:hypothetical protein